MSDIAIRVEEVSKRYRIGVSEQGAFKYKALRDVLAGAITAPARRLCALFGGGGAQYPLGADEFWALKDVSFDVKRGEVVGIIGRNGAGKSTLLKVLTRITEPTSGRVTLSGRVGSLLEVGTGFHPELTGRENIYMNGAILGMRKAEIDRKFDEIVAFAEVEKFLDTPVKHYSSGMYVRLAFAVAAHMETEILMVDEVLAVGDLAFQKKCLGKMGEVANGGRTVLFVSHNMAAVTQLCTTALLLEQGRIRYNGASQTAVERYLSAVDTDLCAEISWPTLSSCPGDDFVRLNGCRVLQNNKVSSQIDVNEAFAIEIDFTILREMSNLVRGVNFYNSNETCLFAHCDWGKNDLPTGAYRTSVTIPRQTLAEGKVNVLVQLTFFEPYIPSVVIRDILRFNAIESDNDLSIRGPYKGIWPGLVRLALTWDKPNPL
ncbi:MAG: ABC transporter ATP-binding protein [Armatimonadota bacterium]